MAWCCATIKWLFLVAHQSQLATWDLLNKVGINDRYMLS
jgi:hypothetical protein